MQKDLANLLAVRQLYFPALLELAGPLRHCPTPRQQPSTCGKSQTMRFAAPGAGGPAAPALLGELGDCLYDEPFHALAAASTGRVSREFGRLLRTEPGRWGGAGWLLKAPEVQEVVNLLAVRQPVLTAIAALHTRHRGLLARCLQRPAHPGSAWKPLACGLVLLHHARAGQRTPGYPPSADIDAATWKEAWTTAVALDAAAMTPYFIRQFGTSTVLSSDEALKVR